MNAVKTNLKRLRLARGMTQDELAEKLHVVRQTVSSWETGKTTPDVETLTAIAEALGVDITELIYGTKPADFSLAARDAYIRRVVMLCLLTAMLGILAACWEKLRPVFGIEGGIISAITFRPEPKNVFFYSFGSFFLPSAAWAAAGACTVLVIGIRKPVALRSKTLRVLLVVCAAAALLLYWSQIIYAMGMWLSVAAKTEKIFGVDTRLLYWLYERQYLFFPSGILLALGASRRT